LNVTLEQLKLARHALGLPNRRKISYRNHFVTGPGCTDYDNWMQLVSAGNATRRNGSALTGGDDIFFLTDAGAKSALVRGEKLDAEDFPEGA
jgi:hypothetical protein